jgi:hypothetical protein
VSADGNCIHRCGSIFAFGHDNWHREIRARIVMELVINEGLYLYIRRGTDIKCNVKENFAQYSEIFTPGIILTDHIIASIFEEETRQCAKLGTYWANGSCLRLLIFSNAQKCQFTHSLYKATYDYTFIELFYQKKIKELKTAIWHISCGQVQEKT